jgi:hypothetical protein
VLEEVDDVEETEELEELSEEALEEDEEDALCANATPVDARRERPRKKDVVFFIGKRGKVQEWTL